MCEHVIANQSNKVKKTEPERVPVDKVTGRREIRQSAVGKIKGIGFHLRDESVQKVANYCRQLHGAIHSRNENPNVLEPPQHHQDVRVLR